MIRHSFGNIGFTIIYVYTYQILNACIREKMFISNMLKYSMFKIKNIFVDVRVFQFPVDFQKIIQEKFILRDDHFYSNDFANRQNCRV